MVSYHKTRAVFLLFTTKLALGSAVPGAREDACGPEVQTIPIVQTITKVIEAGPTTATSLDYITKDGLTTIPHSCFTYTVLTPWAHTETATASTSALHCGIQADCIAVTTTTIYAPPHDTCCRNTPTIQIAAPSPTCTKGCRISTITEIVTLDSQSQQYFVKRATPTEPPFPLTLATSSVEAAPTCTTTFRRIAEMQFGPTKTFYPNVIVESVTLDCVGCAVVTRNMGGLGPVAIFTMTVTDEATTTSTKFVCATASAV